VSSRSTAWTLAAWRSTPTTIRSVHSATIWNVSVTIRFCPRGCPWPGRSTTWTPEKSTPWMPDPAWHEPIRRVGTCKHARECTKHPRGCEARTTSCRREEHRGRQHLRHLQPRPYVHGTGRSHLRRPDPRTSSRGRTRKPLLVGAARPRLLPLRSVEQGRTHCSPPDRTRPGGQLGTHRIGPHPGTAEPARGGGHLPAYARGHVRRQPGLIGL